MYPCKRNQMEQNHDNACFFPIELENKRDAQMIYNWRNTQMNILLYSTFLTTALSFSALET